MYMSRFKSPLQVVTKLTAAGFKEWEKAKFAPEVRGPRKFGCLILMACPILGGDSPEILKVGCPVALSNAYVALYLFHHHGYLTVDSVEL